MKHKNFSVWNFLPLIIFIGLAGFLWSGLKLDPRHLPSVLLNKPLPDLRLPSLFSNKGLSKADFKGQVSLLNVWASWCTACRGEQAILLDIAASNRVNLYGLSYKDDPSAAKQWLAQFGNPYKLVGVDRSGQAGINLGVYGVPETFVIDKLGIIRYRHSGPLSSKIWSQQILPLIEQLERNSE